MGNGEIKENFIDLNIFITEKEIYHEKIISPIHFYVHCDAPRFLHLLCNVFHSRRFAA